MKNSIMSRRATNKNAELLIIIGLIVIHRIEFFFMLFNIAAELLSLANSCGVFKAFVDGMMWSFETSKVKRAFKSSFSFLNKMLIYV